MLITEPHSTRDDGVQLFLTIDALVDDNGEIVRDKDKHPVPRGFLILQNETNTEYPEAIDVEDAPYTYSETDIPIESETNTDEATEQDYIDALAELGVTDEEDNS